MVVVEANTEGREIRLVFLRYLRDQLLGLDAVLAGAQHDGRTVGVVGTDIIATMPAHLLETDPNIRLNVFHQVADVDGTVGIGQGTGNQDISLVFHGGAGSMAGSVKDPIRTDIKSKMS